MGANTDHSFCEIRSIHLYKRITLFAIGFLECSFFGGNIFGWPQLVYLLKSEGVYSDLCFNESAFEVGSNETSTINGKFADNSAYLRKEKFFRGCAEQDDKFALIFTIGILFYNSSNLIFGYLLHHCGMAFSRIMASLFNIFGYLCVGMTTAKSPDWLVAGIVLTSLGNTQLRMSSVLLAELLPKYKATATMAMSGAHTFSSSLYLCLQLVVEAGLARSHVCWFIAGLSFLTMPLSYFMPSKMLKDLVLTKKESKIPLRKSIFTFSCAAALYHFVISSIVICFHSVYFNSWVSSFASTQEEASHISKILSTSFVFYCLVLVFPGLITDSCARRIPQDVDKVERKVREIQSHFCTTLLLTVISSLMIVTFFFQTATSVYLSILFLGMLRPSFYGMTLYFIKARFPPSHFNRISGLMLSFLATGAVLAYGIFSFAKENLHLALSVFLMLQLTVLVHPLHFLMTNYLKRKLTENIQ